MDSECHKRGSLGLLYMLKHYSPIARATDGRSRMISKRLQLYSVQWSLETKFRTSPKWLSWLTSSAPGALAWPWASERNARCKKQYRIDANITLAEAELSELAGQWWQSFTASVSPSLYSTIACHQSLMSQSLIESTSKAYRDTSDRGPDIGRVTTIDRERWSPSISFGVRPISISEGQSKPSISHWVFCKKAAAGCRTCGEMPIVSSLDQKCRHFTPGCCLTAYQKDDLEIGLPHFERNSLSDTCLTKNVVDTNENYSQL